ncbi:MAG: dTDP-glucose 4,6-dehydratase [Acidobacteria bacterium]|nr:dTDP-glucose 4,6-dehydratase [Acidobacteriota bacterium]
MKLLVTGGAGFIGSNFIRYWLRTHRTDCICNVDKLTYAGNLKNLDDLTHGHELVCRDICDESCDPTLEDLMEGVDAVIHFAAESHVDRSIDSSAEFIRTNVMGTQRLLEVARRKRVARFVHISTDEVYGALGPTGEFTEQTPLDPNSPYAASKAGADMLARSYFRTHGLPVIVTRACNNYGPYQHPEKLIPLMTTNALEGLPLPVYGKGEQVREWLHVEDNCRAIEAVLARGVPGEVYNIGSGERHNNITIVKTILRLLDRPSSLIRFVEDRLAHDFRYALDCSKARRELQWEPQIRLEEGLQMTVTWYQANRAWVESAKNRPFKDYYSQMYESRAGYAGKQ